ncbi:MAG TPA: class I SAM-dependent methyltransferase [Planctomycetota bacterium]|nr:class I SAM-dependent methyltransferase [Planctomycetota bacterium]
MLSDLIGGDQCRFEVVIRREFAQGLPRGDFLLSITPRFGADRAGQPRFVLVNPSVPLPDADAVNSIGGHFAVAYEFLGHFIARGGLTRDARVLDVGCGVGRMAYPLAYYLSPRGKYDGFDIMRDAVEWAQSALGKKFPNFAFRHLDVFNTRYNPRGVMAADEVTFPQADASVDFAFLTSVFTHMLPSQVERYLDELRRVVVKGGRVLITCFLLNEESRALIAAGKSSQPLQHPLGVAMVVDPDVPEASIGFPEAWMKDQLARRNWRLVGSWPGAWCGRQGGVSYQDILVVEKV